MNRIAPILFLASTACLVPQTRDQHVNEAARRVCLAEVNCGNIGEGEKWETTEDCFDSTEDVFEAAWPTDRCDDEDFDFGAWEDCVQDSMDYACDGGFIDGVDALDTCRAANVCSS